MTLPARITDASARIRDHVLETPLLVSQPISAEIGAEVVVKAEHLQYTGSFKLRGAFNRILGLDEETRARGVIAASSGNHGAAVAYVCEALGVPAQVYVPEQASPAKIEKIRSRGAEVVLFGTDGLDTEVEARRRARASGATYVSPYNDVEVVAGQGTIAVEMVRQGPPLHRVYVAVGGGGLIGGIAAYLATAMPQARIIGALPASSPVMAESVAAGRIIEMESLPTLSDGTAGGIEADAVTFEVCRTLVHGWVTVSEEEIAAAMRLWAESHDGMIEGAAGVALAAVMRERGRLSGERVGVVICGGNIARDRWDAAVSRGGVP
jgi:threonine dehydratase